MTAKKHNALDLIEKLMAKGKSRGGMLTYAEVMDTLQGIDLSAEDMEEIYEMFHRKGVEVVDVLASEPQVDEQEPTEQDMEEVRPEEVDLDLSVPEGIGIDDPVRMRLASSISSSAESN